MSPGDASADAPLSSSINREILWPLSTGKRNLGSAEMTGNQGRSLLLRRAVARTAAMDG